MKLKVTTETGSYYEIDHENQFWSKNGGPKERLMNIRSGPWGEYVESDTWKDVEVPEVGLSMYICSWNVWYLTTHVVSVEEIKDE